MYQLYKTERNQHKKSILIQATFSQSDYKMVLLYLIQS